MSTPISMLSTFYKDIPEECFKNSDALKEKVILAAAGRYSLAHGYPISMVYGTRNGIPNAWVEIEYPTKEGTFSIHHICAGSYF